MRNPRIESGSGVIVQGITGRAGRMHTVRMRNFGTNIVAGVSPKPDVLEIGGVPVFATCREAVLATRANSSVLLVGAEQLLGAIEDAVHAVLLEDRARVRRVRHQRHLQLLRQSARIVLPRPQPKAHQVGRLIRPALAVPH